MRRMRTRRPRGRGDTGLALVEVLISTGLLVTLAAGLASVFLLVARAQVVTRHRTVALMLAVDQMERLRALIAAGAGPGAGTDRLDHAGRRVGVETPDAAGATFERHWRVRPASRVDGVLAVEVVVTPLGQGRPGAGVAPPGGARLASLVRAP